MFVVDHLKGDFMRRKFNTDGTPVRDSVDPRDIGNKPVGETKRLVIEINRAEAQRTAQAQHATEYNLEQMARTKSINEALAALQDAFRAAAFASSADEAVKIANDALAAFATAKARLSQSTSTTDAARTGPAVADALAKIKDNAIKAHARDRLTKMRADAFYNKNFR